MAKNPPPSGRSKIRFLFVEADVAPGDMKELTAALSGAIRPTHTIQRIETPILDAAASLGNGANGAMERGAETEEMDSTEESPAESGPSKPRKYRSPKPVIDLDMNAGGKSFESFAGEKGSPGEQLMRYLVAAAWLSEYPKILTITADHVFTCYKSAGWTFDVPDPGLPFRHLKRQGFGDTNAGKFTINHLGLAKVEKMKLAQP